MRLLFSKLIVPAVAAVILLALLYASVYHVRVDQAVVLVRDGVVQTVDDDSSGLQLKSPFADYVLVSRRDIFWEYDEIEAESADGFLCSVKGLGLVYRFDDFGTAATFYRSRPERNRKAIERAPWFEIDYERFIESRIRALNANDLEVGAMDVWGADRLAESGADYGVSVIRVSPPQTVSCGAANSDERRQETTVDQNSVDSNLLAIVGRGVSIAERIRPISDFQVAQDNYEEILSGEDYARRYFGGLIAAHDFELANECDSGLQEERCDAGVNGEPTVAAELLEALASGEYDFVAPNAYLTRFPLNGDDGEQCKVLMNIGAELQSEAAGERGEQFSSPNAGDEGWLSGFYYVWRVVGSDAPAAEPIFIVAKTDGDSEASAAMGRFLVFEPSQCRRLATGQYNAGRAVAAGAPPVLGASHFVVRTDFDRVGISGVTNYDKWFEPFGKIAVINVLGEIAILTIDATSGGAFAPFERGCDEQLRIRLSMVEPPYDVSHRVEFLTPAANERGVGSEACRSSAKQLLESLGGRIN